MMTIHDKSSHTDVGFISRSHTREKSRIVRYLISALTTVIYCTLFFSGLAIGLGLLWIAGNSGILSAIEVDPRIGSKWAPPPPSILRPTEYYSAPSVSTGIYFKRRRRDVTVEGNVLATEAARNGFYENPYYLLPPVKVTYGRYGFRSEFTPTPGGVALLGSSYVEAGYLNASDSWEGLLAKSGISAINYGVASAGGYSVNHYLKSFVVQTKPKEAVWIFGERCDFSALAVESDLQEHNSVSEPLPSFVSFLRQTIYDFINNGINNGRAKTRDNLIKIGFYDERADLPPRREDPLTTVVVAGHVYRFHLENIPQKEFLERGKELLDPVVGEMARICRNANIKLSILYLPSRHTLFAPYSSEFLAMPSEYREKLWEIAARHGVAVSDATPALQQALENGIDVTNPIYDQHLSAAGVRISSEVLYRELIVR